MALIWMRLEIGSGNRKTVNNSQFFLSINLHLIINFKIFHNVNIFNIIYYILNILYSLQFFY